jgi:hypothetical protein
METKKGGGIKNFGIPFAGHFENFENKEHNFE